MTRLGDVPTPALIVDIDKLEANIQAMAKKTRELGVSLRPHIKTHKCVEIAQRQEAAGSRGFTVSTLQEARVLAAHGFRDLTWAFPVILDRIPEARELAERVDLGLLIDSIAALDRLEAQRFPFKVWLKVDCGYHRAGVDPTHPQALELAGRLSRSTHLRFAGLLTHSGHAYKVDSLPGLRAVAEEERQVMSRFAQDLRSRNIEVPAVSVGSTPAMSVIEDLHGIDEARPGNYVFFDLMQVALGACQIQDCAASVLASVVSSQPSAEHCVIDAGALALSKETGISIEGVTTMGEIYQDYEAGQLRSDCRVGTLSQEHGIVSRALAVGTKVRILPNHSCLTVACFDECVVVQGDEVVDRWQIWNGRRF